MIQAALIAQLLGGSPTLKTTVRRDEDLLTITRAGIPAVAVRKLAEQTKTTIGELTDVAGLDRRTWSRRESGNGRLKVDESDRIVRIARAVALAVAALGKADAIEWLHTKNWALGEQRPIDLLDTDIGARQVEHVIGRIEHGVFS